MGADGPMCRAPKQRPGWLVLISAVMLISAARLGLAGLYVLTNDQPGGTQTALVLTVEDAAARTVELAANNLVARHASLLRAQAAVQIALALLLLYVASALFSLDARGRWLALTAAWAGVAYHVVGVVFGLALLRPELLRVAPEVVKQLADGGEASAIGEVLLTALPLLSVALPVIPSLFGFAFSGLILLFFGGRRGRVLYGYEPEPQQSEP